MKVHRVSPLLVTFSASHTVNLIYSVAVSRAAVTSVETAILPPTVLLRAPPPPLLTLPSTPPSSPTSPPVHPAPAMPSPPLPGSLSLSLGPAPGVWRRTPPTGRSEDASHRASLLDGSEVHLLPALPPASSGTRMWGMRCNHHLPWGILGRREVRAGCKAEGERGGAVAPVKIN